MARVSTYLNFARDTEAAFAFYRSVFGTEYATPIVRYNWMLNFAHGEQAS